MPVLTPADSYLEKQLSCLSYYDQMMKTPDFNDADIAQVVQKYTEELKEQVARKAVTPSVIDKSVEQIRDTLAIFDRHLKYMTEYYGEGFQTLMKIRHLGLEHSIEGFKSSVEEIRLSISQFEEESVHLKREEASIG